MKQFLTIFKFELKNLVKEKAFIAITIIFCLAAIVGLSIPRIIDMFKSGGTSEGEKSTMIISGFSDKTPNTIKESFKLALSDYDITFKDLSEEEINKCINDETYDCAVLITSDTNFKYIVKDLSIYDENSLIITELIKTKYRTETLMAMGLSETDALIVSSAPVECETVSLNVNVGDNYFSAYILSLLIMMCVMMYGSVIASKVASEKSSRAMEMLITSASPKNMMFAKIFAAMTSCIIQIALVGICLIVGYKLNYDYFKDNQLVQSIFSINISSWILLFVFFIMGFLIYSFLFGALGSLVSRTEDINVVVTPVMMVLMVVGYAVIFNAQNPTSTLMVVLSFLPVSSPMAMYVRINMGTVTNLEIAISIVLLFVTTILIGYLASIIYRLGTLLYGNAPKFKDIIKLLKNSKDNI